MHKEWLTLNNFSVAGLSARTCNQNEMTLSKAKIGILMADYWHNNLSATLGARLNPGTTYAVYTDYASDEHGDYTYLLGEHVTSQEPQALTSFSTTVIPAGRYVKFTTEAGPMPQIVINAWHAIWQMTPSDLAGTRSYQADFEVYDKRALDPAHAIVDIYIGLA